MFRPFHFIAPRTGLAAAAAVLAVGTLAAGATTADATTAGATTAAAKTAAATPKTALIPVDHQLCYTTGPKTTFRIPAGVRLVNQFSPNGFVPRIGPLVLLCNPVVKVLPTGKVTPVTNPRAHLACYTITAPTQPAKLVVVANQFGKGTLTTGQPNLLCLPSWKSLTGPPNAKPVQPPGLSHFTCYAVTPTGASGFNPPAVKLQDEFSGKLVPVKVSNVPAELCLPTEKIVGSVAYPIVNPVTHLLCFPVSQTPIKPRVFVQNQFGSSIVTIGHTSMLCVPSTKTVLVPVDHQLCYLTGPQTTFRIPPGVRLVNQFSPDGFVPKIGPLRELCNPVVKVLPSGAVTTVTNPRAHLACYTITATRQPIHVVVVTNQFGKGTLTTGQPNLLCLPSWKSLTGPPNTKPVQPPGLSHFTCYRVTQAAAGGFNPPVVRLLDEFSGKLVTVKVSNVPAELCLPTEKIVSTAAYPIVNPVTHLLCFPVSQTPIKPRVFVQNQFGTSIVTIEHTSMLCVPSIKTVLK